MSPEMKSAFRAFELCRKQIEELKHRAIQGGDAVASLVLVDVAVAATQAVHDLWFEPPIENPFSVHGGSGGLAARREFLSFALSDKKALPTLHPEDSNQKAMLQGIEKGPYKARKRKSTDMKTLMEGTIRYEFGAIQSAPKRPSGVEGQIWDLVPLSPASANSWADMIVAWLWKFRRTQMIDSGSWLYKLARPEVEFGRGLRKREAVLDAYKKRHTNKYGELELEHAERYTFRRNAIRATMNSPKITPANIKNGLRSEIAAYLNRNLVCEKSTQ